MMNCNWQSPRCTEYLFRVFLGGNLWEFESVKYALFIVPTDDGKGIRSIRIDDRIRRISYIVCDGLAWIHTMKYKWPSSTPIELVNDGKLMNRQQKKQMMNLFNRFGSYNLMHTWEQHFWRLAARAILHAVTIDEERGKKKCPSSSGE